MSTYFTTFPLTVPFPLFSEALQTSVYWEPSLSVSVSVLNATSPAIAELRADSEALDETLRAEYEAMRDFFVETLEKFQGTDPEIDDYIARIYTTFLEQTVDEEVYGEPVDWSARAFTRFSPQYLLEDVEWFQHLPESKREEFITNSSRFNRGSSNYFYGLASAYNAVLRRVISKRRSDWDLWREVPKLQEMYARIELLRDQMQVRNSLRGENSDEIRSLEEAMRVELSQALLDLMTARFSFDLTWEAYSPTGQYSNHMAYIETKITNPALADEIASQVELEVNNNRLAILTALQDEFPEYEIPLEIPTRAYNQTGMVSNLNMSRNGRRSDYPVRDALTGNYLWVGGDEYYTGIRRYGGNGPAVESMSNIHGTGFLQYIFPDTTLVSEYEDEYALAGRGDEFDDYVDEWNRYHALASGQGELQEGDELFVVDGEFDLEAALNGLREYYNYYGSVEAVMELQFTGTGLYTMSLEELYEAVNRYDDAMEEYSGATPFTVAFESETFKTQQSESYLMDDASRPFFDPESEGPYELSESPSGSEVSYGAERVFGMMPHRNTWKLELYLDDLVPVDKGNLGDFCEGVAERLNRLAGKVRNSERPLYDDRMKDYNTKEGFDELAIDLEDFAMDFEQISEYREFDPDYQYDTVDMNMTNDILDRMYDWGDSFKTMVIDTNGPNPLDNDFTALWYDRYSLSAEDKRNCGCGQDPCVTYGAEPEMRRRVRTISGKPHTPRKLVKDQDITPEEAAKRVKLEAEGRDMYYTREEAMVRAQELGCHDVHTHEMDGRTVYMPCYTHERYENMLNKQAEDKKDDTVISTREESGITTETRQYKKKKYNPEKMKQDIPAQVLDQTDSDDLWVALAFGILGAGIAATVTNMAWMKRRRGD
tara:strand:+ start:1572 stop:4223 length:2652 start_codon:yes stop_codon:yes gene_type:complete